MRSERDGKRVETPQDLSASRADFCPGADNGITNRLRITGDPCGDLCQRQPSLVEIARSTRRDHMPRHRFTTRRGRVNPRTWSAAANQQRSAIARRLSKPCLAATVRGGGPRAHSR